MQNLDPALQSEYTRWCNKIAPIAGVYPEDPDAISWTDALRAHYLICDHFGREGEKVSTYGPRSPTRFLTCIDRQFVTAGGSPRWSTVFEKAATLMFGIIKTNHPFHDGNKRTGLLCALFQLHRANRIPTVKQREFERLAVDIADGIPLRNKKSRRGRGSQSEQDEAMVRAIADFFKKSTVRTDTRDRVITYRQLKRCLAKFDINLSQSQRASFADVVYSRQIDKTSFFFLKTSTVQEEKFQIAFPGWGREVPKSAVADIRRRARLTPSDGVSSEEFFGDSDPIETLIATYHGPLLRLRDR